MKFWFFIVVLANLMFFLWEMQKEALNKVSNQTLPSLQNEKQILLVSELAENQREASKVIITVQSVAKDEVSITDVPNKIKETMLETGILERKGRTEVSKEKSNIKTAKPENSSIAIVKTNNDNLINTEVVEKEMNCYEIGPFMNEKEVSEWLQKNNSHVIDSFEIFKKDRQQLSSYLVYYPAAETYAESRKNQQMLKEKGITDLWLFRKGDMRGAISLGLFKKKKRAEKLVDYLSGNGIQVKIMERIIRGKSPFARIMTPGNPVELSQPLTATKCPQ